MRLKCTPVRLECAHVRPECARQIKSYSGSPGCARPCSAHKCRPDPPRIETGCKGTLCNSGAVGTLAAHTAGHAIRARCGMQGSLYKTPRYLPGSGRPTAITAIAVLSKQQRRAAAEVCQRRGAYSRHGLVYRSYESIPSPDPCGAWQGRRARRWWPCARPSAVP